jgi:hypothetical protein
MKKLWIVGVLAASLGLAACGATASLNEAVASIGSSQYLQVHLTGSAAGPGSTETQQDLSALSVDLTYSNPTGNPLSQSQGVADAEMVVNAGGTPFLDVREVASDVYVKVDAAALSNIPNVKLSSAELSEIQLLFGGRWFEIPASLLNSYVPKSAAASATATKERAIGTKIIDDLTTLINDTSYTSLSGGGYSQTGTLQSVVNAVWPTIASLSTSTPKPTAVKGTYTITVTTSGTTATGGSVSITAPNGASGDATATLTATVAHASVSVVAPTGATIITPSLLKGLIAQSGSAAASSAA